MWFYVSFSLYGGAKSRERVSEEQPLANDLEFVMTLGRFIIFCQLKKITTSGQPPRKDS